MMRPCSLISDLDTDERWPAERSLVPFLLVGNCHGTSPCQFLCSICATLNPERCYERRQQQRARIGILTRVRAWFLFPLEPAQGAQDLVEEVHYFGQALPIRCA